MNRPLTILPFLAAGMILAGCGRKHEPPGRAELPPATVRVQTVRSETGNVNEGVVGTVRARFSAVIAAKVNATVEKITVVPGASVKAGDLLIQLDAREIQARLDQAVASREQAEKDLGRFTRLLADKAVTPQEFETVQTRKRIAQAAVTEAETTLSYAKVVAPFDGVITRKHVDKGDLATPGKPLLEMEDPRSLQFEAAMPEAIVGSLKVGAPLRVHIDAAEADLDATVSEISPSADSITRTFLAKLDLPPSPRVRAGQFGRVLVPTARATFFSVPASALVVRGQMEMVFVLQDGRARMRIVKTGKRTEQEVELLSGINAREQIVVDGAQTLTDGQRVTIQP